MNATGQSIRGRTVATGIFFLQALASVFAQSSNPTDNLRMFSLKLYESSLEMKVENQREQRSLRDISLQRDYFFAEQSVGLVLRGSVYHPNLLEFRLQPQFGISYQRVTLDPPGATRQTTRALQRYHLDASVLKEKAYATTLFADRDTTFRDFDFFNRARVDSLRYGGSTGYRAGRLPVTASYLHSEEKVRGGLLRDLQNSDENLTIDASHTRGKIGRTNFSYQVNRYHRSESGGVTTSGTNHSASLFDSENWGKDRRAELQSSAFYNRLDDRTRSARSLAVMENLSLEHAHRLTSSLHYAFNQRRAGVVDNDAHDGSAALTHQLYESLTSRLQLQGVRLNSHSPESTFGSSRWGLGLDENYTKRLGAWGRLNLGGNIRLDQERRESTGQWHVVAEESHTLSDGITSFLRQPNVQTVSTVTDLLGRVFAETLDYVLIGQGALTEIRRVPGGLIPNGGTVLVNYTAATPPAGGFTTLGRSLQVRLELFDRLFAVYGRINLIENSGEKFLVLQNVNDRVAGTELQWKWLQAGAEYQDFQSNLTSYRSQRLFQTLAFEYKQDTTLALDFNQSLIHYVDAGLTRRNYSVICRYRTRPFSFLVYSLEGGVRRETGRGFNQYLTTVRSTLEFDYGQLAVNLGYEYEKESYLADRHQKHYFFMRAKRKF